jgi:hypothetical protein
LGNKQFVSASDAKIMKRIPWWFAKDDVVSECHTITKEQEKSLKKEFTKRFKKAKRNLDIRFYDYGDITITVIKQKKKVKQ